MNLISPISKDFLGAQSRWALDTGKQRSCLTFRKALSYKQDQLGVDSVYLTDIPLENIYQSARGGGGGVHCNPSEQT